MNNRYSCQQIILHWASALIIIWATVSGFYISLFEPPLEHKSWIAWLNISLTTLYIPFFILRIGYALLHGKPKNDLLTSKEEKMAQVGHFLLYLNIAVVLLSGVLMMTRPIEIFGLLSFPQPIDDELLNHLFNRLHIISCITLALLIVGHVFAVIKHHLSGKPLLRRMRW